MSKTEEELIREAKNEYMRNWRRENKKKFRATQRKWQQENPEKVKQYQENYWKKKALEGQKQA